MECLEMSKWTICDRESLKTLKIDPPDERIRDQVYKNWDAIAKPLESMGVFEHIFAKIGAITGNPHIELHHKAVLIFCADNGIVEEGISQSGKEVTLAVARSMGKQQSSVGRMAASIGAKTIPVDVGIESDAKIEGVLCKKICKGTRNFLKEPAMTEEETIRAISVGMELVRQCLLDGIQILAMGEMGIGNTTTSSAVTGALLRCPAKDVTGRGAGLSLEGLIRKQEVIDQALEKYSLYEKDALTVLSTVGGLDLAALTGVCMGAALYHVPVVLDGMISMTAALVAEELLPGTKAFLIPSHMGKEPAMKKLAERLDLCPVIHADLALGEGTGAVMMFGLLDMAGHIYSERTTFEDIQVEQYQRFES